MSSPEEEAALEAEATAEAERQAALLHASGDAPGGVPTTSRADGPAAGTRRAQAAQAASQLEAANATAEQARVEASNVRAALARAEQAREAAEAEAEALRATAQAEADDSGNSHLNANLVDANAIVDAMRSMNFREPAIDKGKSPQWDFSKGERFSTFEFCVELWLKGHGLHHLLTELPTGPETATHDKVMAVVCFALPPQDLEYVRVFVSLKDVWSALRAKYMPSKEAEIRSLWDRFSRAVLKGHRATQVEQYCTYIMSLVNQLTALGAQPAQYQVSNKLFEPLGREFVSLRSEQGGRDFLTQIAAITNHARALDACGPPQGAGRDHGPRGRNPQQPQRPAVAAVAANETRTCYVCKKTGHLHKDCPDIHPEVR